MKNARFYVAFTFILFGLLCFGCSNAANDAGGENKNISASQVDGGISVTVDVPEGMPILEFYRTKKGEGYRDNWYTIENAISGQTISVIDYYCEADSNYTYWVQYLNKDWVYQKSSDEIEITSSKKGFTPPSVSNSPKATFNSETNKLDFSVIPEFANIQSQITGYQKVKYEFLYQCENDSKWECICEFNKGDSSTKPLYDWILTRHSGHKLKYHSFKVRFVSDDGKSNYGFNIGKEAAISDFVIPGITPLDLTKCIPVAENLKEKILGAETGRWEDSGESGPEARFNVFDSAINNGIIQIHRTHYMYKETSAGLAKYSDNNNACINVDDNWSYNVSTGVIMNGANVHDHLYYINEKYYSADLDFKFERMGNTTGFIYATFGCEYEIDEGGTNGGTVL